MRRGTNGFRQINFRSANGPRHDRGVSLDVVLYERLEKLARQHGMSVSWFIEETLEVTADCLVPIARSEQPPKPARHSHRVYEYKDRR